MKVRTPITLVLLVAAIAAPTALPAGSPDAFQRAVNRQLATDTASPSGLISENSASQNRLDRISVQSVAFSTEHSAGQNGTGQPSAAAKYGPLDPAIAAAIRNHQSVQSVALSTEHSAGQNGTGQPSAAGKYGPLDPAIAAAVGNHSRGQNGVSRSAAASVPAAAPNGFDWGAAGIGATVAFSAMLLGLGVTRLIPRRSSRARLA